MKNKILLLIAVLGITFTSCKKVYNYNTQGVGKVEDVQPNTGDNYNHTDNYIISHDWKIIGAYAPDNGNSLIWKLQAVDSKTMNNYLIIDKADPTLFWNKDYQVDKIIPGATVIHLNIKKI